MAKQETAARKASRTKSEKQREADTSSGGDAPQDGAESYEKELASYLQERIRPGLNRGSIPMLARSIAKEIAKRDHPNGTPEEAPEDDGVTAEGADDESAEAQEDTAEAEDEDVAAEAEDEDVAAEAEDEDVAAEAEDEDVAEADDDDDDVAEDEDEDEANAEAEDDADQDEEAEAPTAFEEDMYELQSELGKDWIVRFSVQNDEGWLTADKEDGSQHLEAPTAEILREAVALLDADDSSS